MKPSVGKTLVSFSEVEKGQIYTLDGHLSYRRDGPTETLFRDSFISRETRSGARGMNPTSTLAHDEKTPNTPGTSGGSKINLERTVDRTPIFCLRRQKDGGRRVLGQGCRPRPSYSEAIRGPTRKRNTGRLISTHFFLEVTLVTVVQGDEPEVVPKVSFSPCLRLRVSTRLGDPRT